MDFMDPQNCFYVVTRIDNKLKLNPFVDEAIETIKAMKTV